MDAFDDASVDGVEPLERRLRDYLSRPDYEPQDRSAIARGMGVSSAERAELRALLAAWESEKKLLRLRGARYAPAAPATASFTGVVRVLPRGKKLFVPHAEGQQQLAAYRGGQGPVELPIAPGRSMGCMERDVVRARVQRTAPPSYRRRKKGPRPESISACSFMAYVEEVLERKHDLWVGTVYVTGKRAFVRGDGRSSPTRIALSEPLPPEIQSGMVVQVQPERYALGKSEACGRVTAALGWPEDAGVDMAALICRYSLRSRFSDAAMAESMHLSADIPPAERAGREDWTSRCVVTIDPASARDYDDAISVSRRTEGPGWELAVHIADVSYYVPPGSALDAEARRRGNSTYLPDRVLPMLPPRLSDDLCSLVQGEDRLTVLCHMHIAPDGEVIRARVARAVIRSQRRLSYPAVLALLESSQSVGDEGVDAMLQEASHLAQALRRRRYAEGALDLDMPELRAVLDEQGRAVAFELEQSDSAHRLIEEFMLAANEQVARMLRARSIPTIYRVHEEPASDKWSDFAHTLREYGIPASTFVSRQELLKLMPLIEEHPDAPRLKLALLRSMMRARYDTKALGHFGLAKADYCHFTSPIRRYADLVTHRGVVRMLVGPAAAPSLPAVGELARLADHISDTERQSAAAEAEALRIKLLEYLEGIIAGPEPQPMQAIVCGVWAHGLAVEVDSLRLRGYVPADLMGRRGGWIFGSRQWRHVSGLVWEEGSLLCVTPHAVDWDTMSVEFRPIRQ